MRRIPAALVGGAVLVGLVVMVLKIAAMGTPGSGSIGAVFLAMAPFAIVALAFLLAPLFAWLKARSTTYAVTDRRVLFLERFPWRRVRSVSPAEIEYVHVSPDPDLTPGAYPRGSVFFKRLVYGSQNRWGRHPSERIGFLDVPDHLEIAGLIRDLRDRAAPWPEPPE